MAQLLDSNILVASPRFACTANPTAGSHVETRTFSINDPPRPPKRPEAKDFALAIEEVGREGTIGVRLPERIRVDLPIGITTDFARALEVKLVEESTANWEFWYGLLELPEVKPSSSPGK